MRSEPVAVYEVNANVFRVTNAYATAAAATVARRDIARSLVDAVVRPAPLTPNASGA
ncbi:hypothetical protein KBX17_09670 [Corynebacterium sp. CCUG 65737]|nr:hypothetical protein [Corynebacterium sp. CCUG 65737]